MMPNMENSPTPKTMFTDTFPDDITSDEELDVIKAQYPDYDDYYVASGSIKERRESFDAMYQIYAPYADKHFLSDLKKHFHERTWEMYIGYTLIKNGVSFTSTNKGPDILIETPEGKIWIEAVVCNSGDGPDRVPAMIYGVASDVPDDEMIIRMANSLDAKFKKYQKYINEDIVSVEDKLIIAVNAGIFSHVVDGDMPLILKAIFAIGFRTLSLPIDGKGPVKPGISTRNFIEKKNGSKVATTFFLEKEHASISAVLYTSRTVLNQDEPAGTNIMVVRNPIATNPLPDDAFPFMHQIITKGGIIEL